MEEQLVLRRVSRDAQLHELPVEILNNALITEPREYLVARVDINRWHTIKRYHMVLVMDGWMVPSTLQKWSLLLGMKSIVVLLSTCLTKAVSSRGA